MVERRQIVRGQCHVVDCAVRSDGSAPAGDFLDALKNSRWESGDSPDEQVDDYSWFLNAIRHWAKTGEPIYRNAVNALDDGIWEFKRGDKRLTFYDTDGHGGYIAKWRIRDHADADAPDSTHWQIPNFDLLVRVGHAFTKRSEKTGASDLAAAADVREEDLSHDR
ncbi:hypothetical protein NGTWS0302_33040 [Mycolicibacterium cyprinidarum]|uniref:Uncharacterized protein n=1 Tax=Mycolicibacterium cyprinidarum TaxID=2860311 RepID=A0ABQ4V8E4_9MYCO|nr:hypothetical protein NGTWS1702_31810 [Mycolicibacterium sp. NGTWSNA01]GJF13131.1 hypothetical protein NGTWS0302_33040 [Mycolicibacterium sp. NGTWS0302]